MYLLPSLRPKTLEEIAHQPDHTERLAKREAEQTAKLKEIRDYKRSALTPGQPPKSEPEEDSEEEEEDDVDAEEEEEEEDADVTADEDEVQAPIHEIREDSDVYADEGEEDAGIEMDDQSLSDDGMEQLPT